MAQRFGRVLGLLLALLATSTLRAGAAAPKQVILCIGDGMGFDHVELTRRWAAADSSALPFLRWPVRLAVSTQPAGAPPYDPERFWRDPDSRRRQVTDSAAAATALATGVKTSNGALGLTPDGRPLQNLTEWLGERGLACGVVTTVPFAHATPAGFAVHLPRRDDYLKIARQMLLATKLRVVIGCGHPHYDAAGRFLDDPRGYEQVGGRALWEGLNAGATDFDLDGDGRIDAELEDLDGDGRRDPWRLVEERATVQALAGGAAPTRLLVVPRVASTLQQERPGDPEAAPYAVPRTASLPSLAELSLAAINTLDEDPDGFFLMIEGGAIDWAAHANAPGRLVEEALDFGAAIAAVMAWVERESSWEETLLIVTADHETGGLSLPEAEAVDAVGGKLAPHDWSSESHTNALVPLYAIGRGSESLAALAEGLDPRRGPYLDNTQIAPAIRALWAAPAAPPPSGRARP